MSSRLRGGASHGSLRRPCSPTHLRKPVPFDQPLYLSDLCIQGASSFYLPGSLSLLCKQELDTGISQKILDEARAQQAEVQSADGPLGTSQASLTVTGYQDAFA